MNKVDLSQKIGSIFFIKFL